MRTALYARFSTDRQSEASVEDQFRVCERLAGREGFDIVHRFEDRGISGGTTKRPGYQALLRAARRREFEVIVAEDLKRLWREQAEQWRAIKEFIDLSIAIVTASGIDSRQQNFEIIASVIGAAGELERKEAAYRTRRGLEGRAVAGKPTGGKAYGYIAARDSGTGELEVNEAEAAVVRRVFEMYAEGMSPRAIAGRLNEEGVPSPGATWKRTARRRDAKWLASAVHGEEDRGSGILNNRRYVGVVVWGRTQWRRGAADSSKRHRTMNAKPMHEALDERLRIVPQSLWDRVKVRQAEQRRTVGARVKGALGRNAAGAGRPSRYPLSGLLRCAECGASYTMADGRAYACASHVNGAACTNTIRVARTLAEDRILASVKADLRDPAVIAEAERRFARAMAERMKPDTRALARIAELEREVGNLVGAIAGGVLKASPALGRRLAATEEELARLKAAQQARAPVVARIAPRVAERFERIVTDLEMRLQRDPERSRAALIEAIGPQIVLQPDESRRFLWAEYGLEESRIVAAVGMPEIMVAGARFRYLY
jgi:DNA invertase Pin-like site-specific DNA recombinase